jgi:hypothetical protein
VDAATARQIRNPSETEDAVYVIAGGKDGYVGRDGVSDGEESSRSGSGAPGAA